MKRKNHPTPKMGHVFEDLWAAVFVPLELEVDTHPTLKPTFEEASEQLELLKLRTQQLEIVLAAWEAHIT